VIRSARPSLPCAKRMGDAPKGIAKTKKYLDVFDALQVKALSLPKLNR